jgi:tRNA (guanine37-N1)-methyltransferase
MIDAAVRLIPGVLGDPESAERDSFAESLLDYPHYTRPAELRGLPVPEVLLSGNHEAIRLWRRKEALRSTYRKRPDLLQDRSLTDEDRRLIGEIVEEGTREASV